LLVEAAKQKQRRLRCDNPSCVQSIKEGSKAMQRTSLKAMKASERAPAASDKRRPTLEKSAWAKSSWRSAPVASAKSGWGITRKH
jgi:hypothetical protein